MRSFSLVLVSVLVLQAGCAQYLVPSPLAWRVENLQTDRRGFAIPAVREGTERRVEVRADLVAFERDEGGSTRRARAKITPLTIAGIALLGVGSGLALGGGIRWAVEESRFPQTHCDVCGFLDGGVPLFLGVGLGVLGGALTIGGLFTQEVSPTRADVEHLR